MSRKDLFWFLRPTLGVILCYCLAVGLSYVISERSVQRLDKEIDVIRDIAKDIGELRKPSQTLTPREVVEIQTDALRNEDQKTGAVQCMCFASPDNLAVTGPLERFARVVRGQKFAALSNPQALLIGEPIYKDENARVLVTAIAKSGEVNAYVWVLARQASEPYEQCWMTDGVFPLGADVAWPENEI